MYWLHISWSVRFKLSTLLRTVLLVCWTCRNHAGSLHLVLITVWNEWCPTCRMVSKHDSHQFEIINQITWNPNFSAFFTILKKGTPSLFPLPMQVDVPVLVDFPRQTGPIRRVEVSVREHLHAWHLVLVLIRCLFPKSQPFFLGGAVKNFGAPSCFKVGIGSWMICTIFIGVDEILQSEAIGLKDPQKSIWNQNHPLMLCRWVKRYWNRNSNGKSGLTCTESTHTLQVGGRHTIAQDAKGPASHVGCNCTAKEWQFWG